MLRCSTGFFKQSPRSGFAPPICRRLAQTQSAASDSQNPPSNLRRLAKAGALLGTFAGGFGYFKWTEYTEVATKDGAFSTPDAAASTVLARSADARARVLAALFHEYTLDVSWWRNIGSKNSDGTQREMATRAISARSWFQSLGASLAKGPAIVMVVPDNDGGQSRLLKIIKNLPAGSTLIVPAHDVVDNTTLERLGRCLEVAGAQSDDYSSGTGGHGDEIVTQKEKDDEGKWMTAAELNDLEMALKSVGKVFATAKRQGVAVAVGLEAGPMMMSEHARLGMAYLMDNLSCAFNRSSSDSMVVYQVFGSEDLKRDGVGYMRERLARAHANGYHFCVVMMAPTSLSLLSPARACERGSVITDEMSKETARFLLENLASFSVLLVSNHASDFAYMYTSLNSLGLEGSHNRIQFAAPKNTAACTLAAWANTKFNLRQCVTLHHSGADHLASLLLDRRDTNSLEHAIEEADAADREFGLAVLSGA